MTPIQTKILAPKQNFISVKADAVEVVTEQGGLAIPDSAQAVAIKRKGTVVAVGPQVDPVNAIIGERVLFSAYAGTTIDVDGEELELMRDTDVLAGIE